MAKLNKAAQIEVTINWFYVLIAGAVILLFFVGLIVNQKTVSEKHLAVDIVGMMDSIFTGAGVSEKTKQPIDTGGLADYTLNFACEEGVSKFGIESLEIAAEDEIHPLFSPSKIQTNQLLLWSLPFRFPFKVIDFLFVSSINTKYVLLGSDRQFIDEFMNVTEGFNREYALDLTQIDPGKNYQLRIIDLDGTIATQAIPENLLAVEDEQLSLASFSDNGAIEQVTYYQKSGAQWQQSTSLLSATPIVSLGGERAAAKYAAIFAADEQMYRCNMQKAFRRLQLLTEVYGGDKIYQQPGGKLEELRQYYLLRPELGAICLGHLENYEPNVRRPLMSLQNQAPACRLDFSACQELIPEARDLQTANQNLRRNDCLGLY